MPVQVQGPDGQVHTIPLWLAGQYQAIAKTGSEINKNTAEAQKNAADAAAVPIKSQLESAQAEAQKRLPLTRARAT